MDNTRRQTIVIAVLILLIACAGWFARSFNERAALNADKKITDTQQEKGKSVFAQARLNKETARNNEKQELEKIKNGKTVTKNAKIKAQAQLAILENKNDKEALIEKNVKAKGFDDALCYIESDGVELSIKSKGTLSNTEVENLKNIIIKATGFSPSNIIIKPANE